MIESRPAKPTPAQKACVHQTKVVTVNDAAAAAATRMSQSMTAVDGMFSGAATYDAAAADEGFDRRLFSPQFNVSGAHIDSSSAAAWDASLQQQQLFLLQQQQMNRQNVMQQSSQDGQVFSLTAMPLQTVGSIFKNNINQLG